MTDWNVPPPPPPPGARPRIRGRRVATGLAFALAGHLATIALMLAGLVVGDKGFVSGAGLLVMLGGQLLLFVVCLVVGIVLTVRHDGVGVGLLIGWAVGLLVAPVSGFGLCVWAIGG
jgi:hypothetical protein